MYIVAEDNHVRLHEEKMNEKPTTEVIDQIQDYKADVITIPCLTQESFEYFIDRYADNFSQIIFWKMPRVEDLSPLEALSNVEEIEIFWNQKSHKFWDLSKNIKLQKLRFHDCNKMDDLSALVKSSSLKLLEFGNKNDLKYMPQSLEPLESLGALEVLSFNAKAIGDNAISPLSKIQNLKELSFNSVLFSSEKLAWLKARISEKVHAPILNGYEEFIVYGGDPEHREKVMIHGKRKPSLSKHKDHKRIQKYITEYAEAVKAYKENPTAPEPE